MARHSVSGRKISLHNLSSTVTTTSGHEQCQSCGSQTHQRNDIAGTRVKLARQVENEDTWQRSVDVETHRHQDTVAPRALPKVQEKAKAKARNEHLKPVCVVATKDTRRQTANSRLRHGQTAERLVA